MKYASLNLSYYATSFNIARKFLGQCSLPCQPKQKNKTDDNIKSLCCTEKNETKLSETHSSHSTGSSQYNNEKSLFVTK